MKKQFLACGKIVSTHGLHGELKLYPWLDQPEYLLQFSDLYIGEGQQKKKVKGMRLHKQMVLLTLEGISSIDQASLLRGQTVYFDRNDDPEGGVYVADYEGLAVVDAQSGQSYGTITDIIRTGANDVFVLRDSDGIERLVPDIPQVVISTDFDANLMEIVPLKGLFEHED